MTKIMNTCPSYFHLIHLNCTLKAGKIITFFLGFIVTSLPAYSDGLLQLLDSSSPAQHEFLSVEEAFQLSGEIHNSEALIHFTVTPGHYLYKKRFSFTTKTSGVVLSEPSYPPGKEIYDENFDEVLEVFDHDITIRFPISTTESNTQSSTQFNTEIDVRFQGCAEAGLCYPPTTQTLTLSTGNISVSSPSASIPEATNDSAYGIEGKSFFTSLLLFLLAGIGLTFTPCVLPMVPILSSLLVGSASSSKPRIITLTLAYILSMSLTFALAGTLMGLFGASLNLQAKLQSPWVLGPFSALFVLLALSLFGLYELQLPEKLRNRLGQSSQSQGTLSGALIMGVLSALVVSPCVSAPLAGALIYIGTTGDAFQGGISLFALGLGMGVPLILIGIGGRRYLPKAGAWMESVKAFFGFLLLAVAIWMLERIIPGPVTLLLWGALSVGAGIKLEGMSFQPKQGFAIVAQTAGIILLVYGGCLIVGAAKGNSNPLQPLATKTSASGTHSVIGLQFTTVDSLSELDSLLEQAKERKQPAMVDVYADWCISCKVMERTVFPDPDASPLLQSVALIKLDITNHSPEHQAWLNRNQLFGPPALLFFDASGKEQTQIRAVGEVNADQLVVKLNQLLNNK